MPTHTDRLAQLNQNLPLSAKLAAVHEAVRTRHPCVDRIAVAIFEPKGEVVHTFVDSSRGDRPLQPYQAKLAEVDSLRRIAETGQPRVLNDLRQLAASPNEYTQSLLAQGYFASYTLPIISNGTLFGFVFFDSYLKDAFRPELLDDLDVYGHIVALATIQEIGAIRTLVAALQTAKEMTHHRDMETGGHLDRMARFAQLIARAIAPSHGLDDEYIEHLFLFAPLHDVGKIGIPDRVLLKPGKLSHQEYEIMKRHVATGRDIVDQMLRNFGLDTLQHVDMLRNIAHYHHEAVDGSGYPEALEDGEIPVEARIIAVADVFDALTSRRPYKDPWTNDEAFAFLRRLAGSRFDRECVAALEQQRAAVEEIQRRFREEHDDSGEE